ncbi:MAG: Na+/H+ antiporter NhaC family protein [Treponema sp.]
MEKPRVKASGRALIPFLLFVVVYLGIGVTLIAQGDPMGFYGFKGPIAVVIGIIAAFIMNKGTVNEKFDIFVKGCGDANIITMCIIYVLAGAFSVVSKQMGGVDSTVNLGLTLIPPNFVAAGLFIICCFLSIATGTSVGTIAAVGPIAVGLAEKSGIPLALMIAAMVGGAMFGDNLSIISDTTIAATKTQGVAMRDKFKVNLMLALPAAILTIILLLIFGRPTVPLPVESLDFNLIKVLPYIFVLASAVAGLTVFIVLLGGIIFSGCIGMGYGIFDALQWTNHVYDGFSGMFEIFLLSMLTGGLAYMVTDAGGMEWLLTKIKNMVKSKKSAELGIGILTLLTDAATANNTVAIIIDGPIAKEMCEEFNVDPRRSASLLDAFSCVMQGIIPYGAQLLIACSFTHGLVNPVGLIPLLWYPMLLAVVVVLSIFFPFADGYIKKHPWDFKTWQCSDAARQ